MVEGPPPQLEPAEEAALLRRAIAGRALIRAGADPFDVLAAIVWPPEPEEACREA